MTGSMRCHITSSSASIVMLHMDEECIKCELPLCGKSLRIFLHSKFLSR